MSVQRVLRLNRIDVDDPELKLPQAEKSVLVGITFIGRNHVDVKLVGTEGTEPFEVTYKHKSFPTLRASNAACSPEEWEVALGRILRGNEPDPGIDMGIDEDALKGLEAVASVEEGKAMTITVRKKIEGITQRLGTFTLPSSPDTEISLFDWCVLSQASADGSNFLRRACRSDYDKSQAQLKTVHKQLSTLIAAKEASENELIAKFAQLLNEKKLKIRDQQRLLSTATVDEEKVAEVVSAREASGGRGGAKSKGRGKRKAAAPVESESGDEGFEKMAVDTKGRNGKDDGDDKDVGRDDTDVEMDEDRMTPEEETADEDSGDDAPVAPPAHALVPAAAAKERAAEKEKTPPPRRELPFAKKKAVPKPAPKPADDEETDSDDEL